MKSDKYSAILGSAIGSRLWLPPLTFGCHGP